MMIREYLQNRANQAQALSADPSLVICVEPMKTDAGDNAGKILSLLRRAMANPERSLVVATGDSVVFGFSRPQLKS